MWFGDDSVTLHLLCTLLLLHQLHLRSSGVTSWKMGTPPIIVKNLKKKIYIYKTESLLNT